MVPEAILEKLKPMGVGNRPVRSVIARPTTLLLATLTIHFKWAWLNQNFAFARTNRQL